MPSSDQPVSQSLGYVRSLIQEARSGNIERRDAALHAACAAVRKASKVAWSWVWEWIESDTDFGREFTEKMSDSARRGIASILLKEVDSDLIGKYYVWLEENYPHDEDPRIEGAHMVDVRESIGWERDALLRGLLERSDTESLRVVEQVRDQLPRLRFLEDLVAQATQRVRRATWSPPTVQQLARLTQSPDNRFVISSDDLLEVVYASIQRFEDELRSGRMQWWLWNEVADKASYEASPREEVQLSQALEWHLNKDLSRRKGVVVNREVDVSSRRFVDIKATLMEADEFGSFEPVEVCVEVKGCWHDKLWLAMEAQLKRQYLAERIRERGIYVVFWFHCDLWREEDRRSGAQKLTSGDLLNLRRKLEQQAADLSKDWVRIKSYVIDASFDDDWVTMRQKSIEKRASRDSQT